MPETNQSVMLASEDGDFGLVEADNARAEAIRLAREIGCTVHVRDVLTDAVLFSVGDAA